MTKVETYARGVGGEIGSCDSLPFWRRVRLPMRVLTQHRIFSSFGIHTMGEDEELNEGMLEGPDIVLLHNFVPTKNEVATMKIVFLNMRAHGHLPNWVYDLEDPLLLHNDLVIALLPFMRLITVPSQYLAKEVETFSHVPLQHIEEVPSVFDLSVFYPPFLKLPADMIERDKGRFIIGCLGHHAWQDLLPGLFTRFHERLMPEQIESQFLFITDSLDVMNLCVDHDMTCCFSGLNGLRAQDYPQYLARCNVGLLPREGKNGEDICWLWEYGAVSAPCLVAEGSSYVSSYSVVLPFNQPESWADLLLFWALTEKGQKNHQDIGQDCYKDALNRRVALQITDYARVYRRILPMSPRTY